jgi:hypothetical protein
MPFSCSSKAFEPYQEFQSVQYDLEAQGAVETHLSKYGFHRVIKHHTAILGDREQFTFESSGVKPSIQVGTAQVQHGVDVLRTPPGTRQLQARINLFDSALHRATANWQSLFLTLGKGSDTVRNATAMLFQVAAEGAATTLVSGGFLQGTF